MPGDSCAWGNRGQSIRSWSRRVWSRLDPGQLADHARPLNSLGRQTQQPSGGPEMGANPDSTRPPGPTRWNPNTPAGL